MNQQIKELVDKVDRIKNMYEIGPVQRAAIEDFVDLITRECARVILDTPVAYMETDAMHRIRDRVTQHFGTEL